MVIVRFFTKVGYMKYTEVYSYSLKNFPHIPRVGESLHEGQREWIIEKVTYDFDLRQIRVDVGHP